MADDPMIETPDEFKPTGNELYCWMPSNWERVCGPDCVAYESRADHDQALDFCKVLNSIRAIAASAQSVSRLVRAKELRQHDPPPPEVR